MIKRVLAAYPEFQTNLGAFAILKDAVLIGGMSSYDTAKEISKQYPVLITSAEFVTKTIRELVTQAKKDSAAAAAAAVTPSKIRSKLKKIQFIHKLLFVIGEDSLSDSSSSEGDGASNQGGDIRQISREQLMAALMQAGATSRNSLSSISQRNSVANQAVAADAGASTSTASQSTAPSTASTSSAGASGSRTITSSLLGDALSHALGQVMPSMGGVGQSQPEPMASEPSANERYANELVLMQEMGLHNEQLNIQALELTSGDVEAAINLVFSGFGST